SNPLDYIKILARKAGMLFARDVPGFPEQYALWRWHKPQLSLAIFDYGAVLALALPGLIVLMRRRYHPVVQVLAVVIAVYATTIWLYFVVERYRLPILVCLIPFAAYTLSQITRKDLKNRERLKLSAAVLSIYLATWLLNAINPTGPGWAKDPEAKREAVTAAINDRLKIYELKETAVRDNDKTAWRKLTAEYSNSKLREDARVFHQRARAAVRKE
ncbi:MAG: hypothetical protein MJA83_14185, partial [Gammaproteobacteria bacterium]|nr:hypothetical protein [Gammaproteobacteria bacterium]